MNAKIGEVLDKAVRQVESRTPIDDGRLSSAGR
jgi:hypothetical protein